MSAIEQSFEQNIITIKIILQKFEVSWKYYIADI